MNRKMQGNSGPVPVENHYDLFKEIEGKFKDYLGGQEQDYLLIGLRVAYDVLESRKEEPGVFPYSVEFGYLEDVDYALQCGKDGSAEDIPAAFKHSPIPLELLDEMYEYAKAQFANWTNQKLGVGVYLTVKTAMSTRSTGVGCVCKRVKGRKAYLVKKVTYCDKGC